MMWMIRTHTSAHICQIDFCLFKKDGLVAEIYDHIVFACFWPVFCVVCNVLITYCRKEVLDKVGLTKAENSAAETQMVANMKGAGTQYWRASEAEARQYHVPVVKLISCRFLTG